jgi:hypothetical protein
VDINGRKNEDREKNKFQQEKIATRLKKYGPYLGWWYFQPLDVGCRDRQDRAKQEWSPP